MPLGKSSSRGKQVHLSTPDIFDSILNKAPNLIEQDLEDWVVPRLMDHYSAKINSLSIRAYGHSNGSSLPLLAFREQSKEELKKSMKTYLFKSEHWRTGRDINSYLLTSLNRLAQRIYWDKEGRQKTSVPICPACRLTGRREILHLESKLLRCSHCTSEVARIEDEIKDFKDQKTSSDVLLRLDVQILLRSCFALHSRKGIRCPECERFIPASHAKQDSISCPYPNCCYFAKDDNLQPMSHPMGLTDRIVVSLQGPANKRAQEAKFPQLQDRIISEDINADIHMEAQQKFQNEYNITKEVMELQSSRLRESSTSFQKLLMYEAFQLMLLKHPEDMVSYLVHEKLAGDYPIQARIFQEYCSLVEQSLPCVIVKNEIEYNICSLLDPHLDLFTGISSYVSSVKADLTIPNGTIETYNGKRCFIGKIIDVILMDSKVSIKHLVKEYSFSKISLQTDFAHASAPVRVEHFRIPAHYEIGSLVHLQRIRRKIVDSVYFRLNGKRREIK